MQWQQRNYVIVTKKRSLCCALNEWKSHFMFALFKNRQIVNKRFHNFLMYTFSICMSISHLSNRLFVFHSLNRKFLLQLFCFFFNMNAWIYDSILCECIRWCSMIWKFIVFYKCKSFLGSGFWFRFSVSTLIKIVMSCRTMPYHTMGYDAWMHQCFI